MITARHRRATICILRPYTNSNHSKKEAGPEARSRLQDGAAGGHYHVLERRKARARQAAEVISNDRGHGFDDSGAHHLVIDHRLGRAAGDDRVKARAEARSAERLGACRRYHGLRDDGARFNFALGTLCTRDAFGDALTASEVAAHVTGRSRD